MGEKIVLSQTGPAYEGDYGKAVFRRRLSWMLLFFEDGRKNSILSKRATGK